MSWRDRREEERKFEGDVFYDAWRRGLNPDRAVECASDCFYDGKTPEQCVDGYAREVRRQRESREAEAAYLAEQQLIPEERDGLL